MNSAKKKNNSTIAITNNCIIRKMTDNVDTPGIKLVSIRLNPSFQLTIFYWLQSKMNIL